MFKCLSACFARCVRGFPVLRGSLSHWVGITAGCKLPYDCRGPLFSVLGMDYLHPCGFWMNSASTVLVTAGFVDEVAGSVSPYMLAGSLSPYMLAVSHRLLCYRFVAVCVDWGVDGMFDRCVVHG